VALVVLVGLKKCPPGQRFRLIVASFGRMRPNLPNVAVFGLPWKKIPTTAMTNCRNLLRPVATGF